MSENRLTLAQRQFVQERDHNCCQYCISQAKFSSSPLSIEHIIPRSKDGASDFDNLTVSCQGCNNLKYNCTEALDAITQKTASLYNPRRDNWFEHFTWSDDFTQIIGLTATGRVTIVRLQLNREGVINLRQALALTDKHPPLEFRSLHLKSVLPSASTQEN